MSEDKPGVKLTLSDALKFIRAKGFKPEAVARFKQKEKNRGLTSKQVERALMSNKRDKLKTLCHHVAATGHAHLYLSVMGDKVVITGLEQLKANVKPFNRRGFGSTKHPVSPRDAALGSKKKRPYLERITPEARREIGRKGGLAAAKKRAHKEAMRKARGPHWTQKPENREKVIALTRKAAAARHQKTAAA